MADLVLPSDLDPPAPTPDTSGLSLPSDADEPRPLTYGDQAKDVAKSFGSGVSGGTADMLGLPGTIQDYERKLAHKTLGYFGVDPEEGSWGHAAVDAAVNYLGDRSSVGMHRQSTEDLKKVIEPAIPDYTPQTTAGRYAKTIGEFLPGAMVGPEGAAAKIGLGAVAPGVASEFAGEKAEGTWAEPYARLAGAVAGGITGHVGAKTLQKVGDVLEPVTGRGQQAIAARQFHDAAENPEALKTKLAAPDDVPDGIKLTSFQKSGDVGLGVAEKKIETGGGMAAQPFIQRRASNEKVLADSLGSIQPGGSAEDLASGFRKHLQLLDDMETGKVGAATSQAQDATSALGGHEGASFYGRQIQEGVQPQVDAARRDLTGTLDAVGGTATPEGYGSAMRGAEQGAKDTAKAHRNALYQAIDPDGKLNVVTTGPRQAATDLTKGLSPMAAPPTGEEAAILAQMQKMPDVMPFRDLQALDSRITAAMAAERATAGETPVLRRLTELKASTMDAISNGVANQAAYDRQAVAAGHMLPSDSFEARWAAERDAFIASRASTEARASTGTGGGGDGSPRQGFVSGASGAQGQGRGRPRDASGAEGVSSAPLEPNFDQAAADRLNLAKQTHAEYARTYKDGPTAARLKTNGFAGQYQMIDSGVPPTVFGPGASGAEKVTGFLRASKNSPEARDAVQSYAAMSLRRAAELPDGSIDTKKFVTWARAHQDALRAMPDLMAKLGDVHRAAKFLEAYRPFAADHAPSAIPEMFFHSGPSGGEGVANLRNVLGDRMTEASLGDYAVSKLRSQAMRPDGTLDPARVAQFVKTHGPALDALPGLRDRISTAAKATEAIGDAAAARKSALDAYQRDAVGKIIGAQDAADIPRIVGGIFQSKTGASQMMDLARKAEAAGPDAVQGLRRAVADHIMTSYISNTEAGLTGTNKISANSFQTFVRKNSAVLSHVFQPDEVKTLDKMSDVITKMNRSRDAVLAKGHSPTSQLMNMHGQPAHGDSLFAKLAMVSLLARETAEGVESLPIIGEYLGKVFERSGFAAAVAVAGARSLVNNMRASGLRKADDFFRAAMLDPAMGRFLLERYTPQNAKRIDYQLSQRLLRNTSPFFGEMTAPARQPDERQPVARASGGRVEPTDAQKKDHVRVWNMNIAIENRKGSTRSGTGKDGKRWSVEMPCAYGHIVGTTGADGEAVDCYVGPRPLAGYAYIIDQHDAETDKFDEHKVMLGFPSPQDAVAAYLRAFSDGKGRDRIGAVTRIPAVKVLEWAKSGAAKRPTKAAA